LRTSIIVRKLFVVWHRGFGLAAAAFLFLSGLTGAIIAWDHELDAWLNPHLYRVSDQGSPQPALRLARMLETQDTRLSVTWLPLHTPPGESLDVRVAPRAGVGTLGFDEMFINPVSGTLLGQRTWGDFSVSRTHLLPFLYKLHYSLHLPAIGSFDTGVMLLGWIAVAWVIDCCIALWLSFPNFGAWRKSFAFRWKAGSTKLIFDLHRSGAVWAWGVLLIIAISSVSMNLPPIARAVTGVFSRLAPTRFEHTPPPQSGGPHLSREQIIQTAQAEAQRRGWTLPAGGVFYVPASDLYGVGFFAAGMDHGAPGLGVPWIYLSDHDGSITSIIEPGTGSAGDIFLQAQFPLHSGRILGTPGRILITLMGLLVAVLSVTGVIIWARKRRARLAQRSSTNRPRIHPV
jgi:uncharacterized iron-regulated membrane protein